MLAIIDFLSGIIGLFAGLVIIIILLNVLRVEKNMFSRFALFCLITLYYFFSLFRDALFFVLYFSGRKYFLFGQGFSVLLLLEVSVLTVILMVWVYEELSSRKLGIVFSLLTIIAFLNIVLSLYLVCKLRSRSSLGILLIAIYSVIIVVISDIFVCLVAVLIKFIGTVLLSLETLK